MFPRRGVGARRGWKGGSGLEFSTAGSWLLDRLLQVANVSDPQLNGTGVGAGWWTPADIVVFGK